MNARQRLQAALQQIGIEAKKSLGQNFLISDHVIEKIIKATQSFSIERLIEIGPGPGALTDLLRPQFGNYTVIELDHVVADYWRNQGMNVIEQDALRVDWAELNSHDQTFLVSNLPYQISSSIVIDRSIDQKQLCGMVLMFQKEVAQRIRAKHGTDDYGLLSVIAQVFWNIETVADAGPRDFDPAPKVASRVLRFERKSEVLVQHRQDFLQFIKACFQYRRKLLKANLASYLGSRGQSKEALIQWLEKKGLKETARAEEISVELLIELYRHFGKG